MSGNRSLDEFTDAGAGEGTDDDGGDDSSVLDGAEETRDGVGESDAVGVEEPEEAVAEAAVDATSGGDGPSADLEAGGDSVPKSGSDEPDVGGEAPDEADIDVEVDVDADPESLDPPASTYRFCPDGGDCAACGATVEERWRDGDDLVCAGCKEW